jgi:hypothetical protein
MPQDWSELSSSFAIRLPLSHDASKPQLRVIQNWTKIIAGNDGISKMSAISHVKYFKNYF